MLHTGQQSTEIPALRDAFSPRPPMRAKFDDGAWGDIISRQAVDLRASSSSARSPASDIARRLRLMTSPADHRDVADDGARVRLTGGGKIRRCCRCRHCALPALARSTSDNGQGRLLPGVEQRMSAAMGANIYPILVQTYYSSILRDIGHIQFISDSTEFPYGRQILRAPTNYHALCFCRVHAKLLICAHGSGKGTRWKRIRSPRVFHFCHPHRLLVRPDIRARHGHERGWRYTRCFGCCTLAAHSRQSRVLTR